MPSLDDHGKLAAAVIPFYLPILAISFMLVLRHGFRRESGWIYIFIFSITRTLGAILQIAAQLERPVNTNLYIAAAILQTAGLPPLLLATLGFVQTVGRKAFGQEPLLTRGYRLLGLLGVVALIISIVGGINADSTKTPYRSSASVSYTPFCHPTPALRYPTPSHQPTALCRNSISLTVIGGFTL